MPQEVTKKIKGVKLHIQLEPGTGRPFDGIEVEVTHPNLIKNVVKWCDDNLTPSLYKNARFQPKTNNTFRTGYSKPFRKYERYER